MAGYSPDVMDTLIRFGPTDAGIAAEWSGQVADQVLAGIIGTGDPAGQPVTATEIPLRFVATRPVRRHRTVSRVLPVAASVVVLAVGAGALFSTLNSGDDQVQAGGSVSGLPFDPPAGLSDKAIDPGQYSYRVVEQVDLDADGKVVRGNADSLVDRSYVSYSGAVTSIRTGSQTGCSTHLGSNSADGGGSTGATPSSATLPSAGAGYVDFSSPDVAFFADMPTDVDALTAFFRKNVEGSSSLDEAVFVAVGDSLRTADGLASPKLRAAMLAMLSRTPGVLLHHGVSDYLGRSSIRADFVDQRIRPGQVESLYFDPTTFQLLQDGSASNTSPSRYEGPSPAYSGDTAENSDDPDVLSGPAFVDVMRTEKVVDSIPAGECTTK